MTELDLDTLDIATPEHYERNGYPHAEWTYLRKHAPVFWYARDNVDPFWAITKHADIIEISKQPDELPERAAARGLHQRVRRRPRRHGPAPAQHGSARSRALSQRHREAVHAARGRRRSRRTSSASRATCSTRPAARSTATSCRTSRRKITIAVIAEMLGVPREDWELLFRWTNEIIAPQDPEFQRGGSAQETMQQSRAWSCSGTSTRWWRSAARSRRTTS